MTILIVLVSQSSVSTYGEDKTGGPVDYIVTTNIHY